MAGSDLPAWRDPRHLSLLRVAQFEAHEQRIREREQARARCRMEPLMATGPDRASTDFDGAVE
jgi:hypothetical protein